MNSRMTTTLVSDALLMAIWRRGWPEEVLYHSHQGSQYTSDDFQRMLADHGIECSMSRRGECWDNAAMESFFSTLKVERVYRKTDRTRDEAEADLFEYIEGFYNPRGRHSTLGASAQQSSSGLLYNLRQVSMEAGAYQYGAAAWPPRRTNSGGVRGQQRSPQLNKDGNLSWKEIGSRAM